MSIERSGTEPVSMHRERWASEARAHDAWMDHPARVHESWAAWVSGLARWQVYGTLTCTPPGEEMNTAYTRRGWAFVKRAANAVFEHEGLTFFAVLELHESGVPHVHFLGKKPLHLDARDNAEYCAELQRSTTRSIGFSRIMPMSYEGGAESYVTKYVTKAQADWWTNVSSNPNLTRRLEAANG